MNQNPKILSGTELSSAVFSKLSNRIVNLKNKSITPTLAVVLVGENPASKVYVRNKTKRFKDLRLESKTIRFDQDVSEAELINKISELNSDVNIHGILVQLPLPDHIDSEKILLSINPIKDVDGFHPYNLGHLAAGVPTFIPCTPKGIMRFFEHYDYELKGKHVVVVGRSNIVGRPISILTSLKKKYSDATTTICHSGSKNIYNFTKVADIVILAIGSPNFLKSEHIKNGAIVIDVGINRIIDNNGKPVLVGDADFDSLKHKVEAITPVPGGVGPMTIAMLVENTVEAAEKLINIHEF